ncbi:enoyl-CoA hydratase [Gammaproteobacteria bacterium 45_16_T64]|nr:enoyl-CoA hydratase [Gammaproteobacteria bacterium 45_16_T64]
MSTIVSYEKDENVAIITLDDGKANAVSHQFLDELNAALDQAQSENAVVLLVGREGKFSAGFDLSVMKEGGPAAVGQLVGAGAKLSARLLSFPTPVVIAATGHTLAMGALMLLSVDYRIGVEGPFKIGLNEVAIGMTMPYFGVELARGRLTPVAFGRSVNNAEIFSPESAVEAGFLDAVVSPDALMGAALTEAKRLSELNLNAHHGTKLRVRESLLKAVEEGTAKEF